MESSHHPSGEGVDNSGPGGDVPVEVARAVEPTTKSHAPVEEHDESLVPKKQRGRPATHCWPSPGSPEFTSISSRDVRGDVVMNEAPTPLEEVPPPPPPAEPPPVLRTSEETDAMMLAAVHPYGHEDRLNISRTEFESLVKGGFYFEEDTLEELSLDEVVEGVNRETRPDEKFSRVSSSSES